MRRRRVLLTATICAAAAGVAWWLARGPAVDRTTFLIADIDNATGESFFDGFVAPALSIALEQSPPLALVSRRRAREALVLLNRKPDEPLRAELVRSICSAAGIPTLLTGTLTRSGDAYVVTVRLEHCGNGKSLEEVEARAPNRDGVLPAIDAIARSLRLEMGETEAVISEYGLPLTEAATRSLNGFKLWTLAEAAREGGSLFQAETLYQRALEQDRSFALALSRFGQLLTIRSRESASLALAAAMQLRDRLTARERFRLDAAFHATSTGDLDETLRALKGQIQLFPRDGDAHRDLARVQVLTGDFASALQNEQRALVLDPSRDFPATLLAAQMGLGQFAVARRFYEQVLAQRPNLGVARVGLFNAAAAEGDAATMDAVMHWAAGKPEEPLLLALEGHLAAGRGRLEEAARTYGRSIQLTPREGADQARTSLRSTHALVCVFVGLPACARDDLAEVITVEGAQKLQTGLIQALLGDVPVAETAIRTVASEFPRDSLVQELWIPVVRAAILIGRERFDEAIRALEPARRFDLSPTAQYVSLYLRGDAMLRAGNGVAALREYRAIVDNPGVFPVSPLLALARLGLARASALAGDIAASRQHYGAFLELWSEADQGIPLQELARKEQRQWAESDAARSDPARRN